MTPKRKAPSILAADFSNLQPDVKMINKSEKDWFHINIMDGVFVPNISFDMLVSTKIRSLKHTSRSKILKKYLG